MVDYRVSVNRELCIACRVAQDLCPQAFVLGGDNGKNRLVDKYSEETSLDMSTGLISEDLYDCVRGAAEACPVQAIIVDKV